MFVFAHPVDIELVMYDLYIDIYMKIAVSPFVYKAILSQFYQTRFLRYF